MRMQFCRNGIQEDGCRLLLFIGLILTLNIAAARDSPEFQKNLPAKVIWAVPGKDVELPCDVTPPTPVDAVNMIFWFKDSTGMPLYSLDARGGPLNEASHLAMTDGLGSRSYFITDDHPSKARLRIQNVNTDDEGVFRCRVDFINSPTRNFKVNLTLVVRPSPPRIFDVEGKEVISDAGPFLEGLELFLSCQVGGGRPRPEVTWWHNGTLLDGVIDSSRETYITVNHLVISSLPRSFWGNHLECRASSSDASGDLVRKVLIKVYLKPNKVKIVSSNDLLSVNKIHAVRCETSGSFPPAKLSWFLGGKPIKSATLTEETTESFTTSILTLNVEAEDDGKDLVCRADNPRYPGGSAEDRRQIHVAYPPKVAVRSDSGLTSPVKEGANVAFKCETVARPDPHSYSWYHDGHLIRYNETGGLLPEGNILRLLQVTKSSDGQYSCAAANSEGETYSPPFTLTVQCNPESPRSCQLRNATSGGIEVVCVAGQDGGLPQSFVLEVSDISIPAEPPSVTTLSDQGEHSLPLYRVLGETPVFRLHSLEPGREYQLLVYAVNAKGRSEPPVVLSKVKVEVPVDILQENGPTLIPIVPTEGSPPMTQSLTLILLVLTAIAALLIVGIISAATVLACRKRPAVVVRQRTTRRKPPDDLELSEAGFNEGFHRRSAQYRASLYEQEIDRNSRQVTGPDLILAPATFSAQSSEY